MTFNSNDAGNAFIAPQDPAPANAPDLAAEGQMGTHTVQANRDGAPPERARPFQTMSRALASLKGKINDLFAPVKVIRTAQLSNVQQKISIYENIGKKNTG